MKDEEPPPLDCEKECQKEAFPEKFAIRTGPEPDDTFAFLSAPIDRRSFIKMAAASWFSMLLPVKLFKFAMAAERYAVPAKTPLQRTLVLVELNGGNDGLNTVIPYMESLYYEARKRVAVPRDQVLHLSDQLGFHPSLESLMPLWKDNHMAIVLGVGYPKPNRSHFRSIAIWETGADTDQYLDEGWLARLLRENPVGNGAVADGIVIGNGQSGPLTGPEMRVINMERPEQFLNQSRGFVPLSTTSKNPALEHVLDVEREIQEAAAALGDRIRLAPLLQTQFPKSRIGNHLAVAAKLITSGTPVPVLKLNHGSFDTHSGQKDRHVRLLKELAEGLAAFRAALQETGQWNDVLVMTYSEFGRRVQDNDSGGTDHGAAAPHFLMGGGVKGGLYGKQPSLTDLSEGDLKYHVDYRSLYETIAQGWWGMRRDFLPRRRYDVLSCFK